MQLRVIKDYYEQHDDAKLNNAGIFPLSTVAKDDQKPKTRATVGT